MGGLGLAGRDDAEDAARVLLERGVEQCPACRRQAEQRRRAGGGEAGRCLLIFRGVFQERFVHGGPPFSPLSHRCAMPAPPKGEPLACRSGLRWMREVSFVGSDSALLSGGGACSDAAARVSEARPFAYARAFGGQREVARPAKGSPSGGAGASAPERDYPLYLLCARPSLLSMMSFAAAAMSGQRSARALASSGGNLPSTQSAKS